MIKTIYEMQKKIKFLTLFLLISCLFVNAQTKDANISFDTEVHDFEKINEADGTATVNFGFTNTGSLPLMIKQVHASCGCTSPDWSKEPVLPGKNGFVSVTYNPRNRPGPFSKTVTVISNATTPNKVLTIKGDVVPKPKSLEDIYRFSMDKIRLKTNHMSFSRVIKDKQGRQSLEIVNVSDKPVKVAFNRVPEHLTLTAHPTTLQPGQEGVIEGVYDASLKNDWGFLVDRVDVMLDGEYKPSNRLTISATIEEDFAGMTAEQKANAPKITFSENTFEFDEIKQGEKIEHVFTITNDGKSDLIIRKVGASCGCTAVSPTDRVVTAGGSTTMKVIFNSAGKVGKQNKTITVISNDPEHSRSILWIKGTVTQS